MKKIKAEYVTSGIFLFVMISFFLSVLFTYVTKKSNRIKDTIEEAHHEIQYNYEILYPFEHTEEKIVKTQPFIVRLYNHIKEWCILYTEDFVLCRYNLIEAGKLYEDSVGWNMTSVFSYNGVVRMRDNYLTIYVESRDITADVKAIIELNAFCREKGIDFFYVNAPAKVCAVNDKDISGILDFKNQNADRLLAMLDDAGVRNYDLRKLLHKDGILHHEAFFITDNHWKIETALWAAKHILEFLHDDYGWNVNPEILSPEKFSYDVYPEWFLGGKGKKVTLARTKPEDFTFIYPKYDTSIKLCRYKPNEITYESGDFFVMCNMDELSTKDYYNKNTYETYRMNDPLLHVENNFIRNGKKILIVRDSFAGALLPFLILGTQNIDAIDLRIFPGSLKSYIKANHPDIVMIMYNSEIPGRLSNKEMSIQDKRLYDFR